MGPPHRLERLEHGLRQRHQPLLVALANDAQDPAGAVNSRNLQCDRLADAQAARIHNGEAGAMDRVADGPE